MSNLSFWLFFIHMLSSIFNTYFRCDGYARKSTLKFVIVNNNVPSNDLPSFEKNHLYELMIGYWTGKTRERAGKWDNILLRFEGTGKMSRSENVDYNDIHTFSFTENTWICTLYFICLNLLPFVDVVFFVRNTNLIIIII